MDRVRRLASAEFERIGRETHGLIREAYSSSGDDMFDRFHTCHVQTRRIYGDIADITTIAEQVHGKCVEDPLTYGVVQRQGIIPCNNYLCSQVAP